MSSGFTRKNPERLQHGATRQALQVRRLVLLLWVHAPTSGHVLRLRQRRLPAVDSSRFRGTLHHNLEQISCVTLPWKAAAQVIASATTGSTDPNRCSGLLFQAAVCRGFPLSALFGVAVRFVGRPSGETVGAHLVVAEESGERVAVRIVLPNAGRFDQITRVDI
jgi:hypothetical protein